MRGVTTMTYQTNPLEYEKHITNPEIPDPENIPEPLGWQVLIRPYPIKDQTKGGIILAETEHYDNNTRVARVVKMGPCAFNRTHHQDREGNAFLWYEVGDFVGIPKFKGSMRKFKGVSFVLLNDDEVVERLPDPMVLEHSKFQLNIPEEDLKKYNTVYNENYMKKRSK